MYPKGHTRKAHVEMDPLGPADISVTMLELGASDKENLCLIYNVFIFIRILNI